MTHWRQFVTQVLAMTWLGLMGVGLAHAQAAPVAIANGSNPIRFPTSGPPALQKTFVNGIELLHNFQYDDAIKTFSGLIKQQPDFAMAYWGLAMCYNHPLWGEQDLDAARHVIADMDKAPATHLSPREKGFIDAVKKLYGTGDKTARDTAYADAMQQLYLQYPNDDEVASFYGLSLLGEHSDKADFILVVKASDVLELVYSRNPNHPGVLHYLVHTYDDPRLAPLGLQSADHYEAIAADSAHALHMPAHIYLDLGLWPKYVHANEASWKASLDRIRNEHLTAGDQDIHALHTLLWLEYGYLQQGKTAGALDCLRDMEKIYDANQSPMIKWYAAMMRATYIVDAPDAPRIDSYADLKGINSIDLTGVELTAPASNLFATGLMASRSKQFDQTRKAIDDLGNFIVVTQNADKAVGAAPKGHQHTSFFTSSYESSISPAKIAQSQLQALQLLAKGKNQDAIDMLQEDVAAEDVLPAGYGPPVPVKPSSELLGEVYLLNGRAQNAMRMFQLTLIRYPNRAASLKGLAKAARLAGDPETASKAQQELRAIQSGKV
jgi:tetratricopeptide (TPR) repeat protein